MFAPARLAVGLKPLSASVFVSPDPLSGKPVPPLIAFNAIIRQTKYAGETIGRIKTNQEFSKHIKMAKMREPAGVAPATGHGETKLVWAGALGYG
jgi:hypothetical protein